ncbi:407_t:CDS:2, partial [Racocetra fulgida]
PYTEGLYTGEELYTDKVVSNYDEVGDYEVGDYDEVDNYDEVSNYNEVVIAIVLCSQLQRQPPDSFCNCELKAASGTKNAFDLICSQKQKKARISEHDDETNLFYLVGLDNKQISLERQKADTPDTSVAQSHDATIHEKVIKAGGSLLCSPAWKWFEEVYINNARHGVCNIEIANEKPCNTKIKTGESTMAL